MEQLLVWVTDKATSSDRGELLAALHVLPELLGDGCVGAAGAVPRQQLALRKVLRARTATQATSGMQAGQQTVRYTLQALE